MYSNKTHVPVSGSYRCMCAAITLKKQNLAVVFYQNNQYLNHAVTQMELQKTLKRNRKTV